jgi:hypothetical protein
MLSSLPAQQQRRLQHPQRHIKAAGGRRECSASGSREGDSSSREHVITAAEGKSRKVSNRLFQEQQQQQQQQHQDVASVVRRSTRLAALAGENMNNTSRHMSNAAPSSAASMPYCFGAAPAMSSHINCQNLPDPDRLPDNAPAHLLQTYTDSKIGSAAEPSGVILLLVMT